MTNSADEIRSPSRLREVVLGRRIHVWGARHDGFAANVVLSRFGMEQAGYIDSSLALQGSTARGLPIELPDPFFARVSPAEGFIIIASGFFADEIAERCQSEGWVKGRDFVVQGELRRFNYQVDVSGLCNLHCISCPRGNAPAHRPPGFMSAETYRKLITKILADDPWTGIITLYNWGEPLLNRDLPAIIRITHEVGLLSAISSNLAMNKDFEDVVQAKPTWFRISNSGWGSHYETTHTGARWETFLGNCHRLADYRRRHAQEMFVEFFFHIYNHNRDDFPKVQALCEELGFTLRYRHAALAPLDHVERVVDGLPLPPEAERTRSLQFLSVEEVMAIAGSSPEKERPCFYENHLWLDWDCSVAHCMEWYTPGLHLVEKSFLEVTPDDLDAARAASDHCKRCRSKGLHRAYCVFADEALVARKSSIPVQREGE